MGKVTYPNYTIDCFLISHIMKNIMTKKKQRVTHKRRTEKRDENRVKILRAIESGHGYYADIMSQVNLSDKTLSKHLRYMEDKLHWITKKVDSNKKTYYDLAQIMTINPTDAGLVGENISEMKKTGAFVYHDYSDLGTNLTICDLPWGIYSYMIINNKLQKLCMLKKEDVKEIEELLFRKIKTNIEYINEHRSKFSNEGLELFKKDKLVLGFNIDLAVVHQSIKKKSLEKLQDMSEDEISAHYERDAKLFDE